MLINRLKSTFTERCRKNPAYSLRAFARSLGMDSSTVSALMSGKRPLTVKTARKIVEGLGISNPAEAQALIMGEFAGDAESVISSYHELELETSEVIASWQHFAILALLELKGFKAQDRTIAERLNIPLKTATESLTRLEKLGLVAFKKSGWELTQKNLATPSGIASGILREGLKQNIAKSLDSLDMDPVELRDMSGMTMAISKARLPEAKKMIQAFRRRLSNYLEDGTRDAVYRLNIQLFPLTKEKVPEKK